MERNILNQDLDLSWDSILDTNDTLKSVNSAVDAMICSLNDKGVIDIEYMSSITNMSMVSLIEELRDYIFQDPSCWGECWNKGFKTKEEYLSGDILTKLNLAVKANNLYRTFDKNIKALKAVLPTPIPYKEIHYSIASSWMDKNIIKNFISDLFNIYNGDVDIEYIPESDKWIIGAGITFYNSANYTFGTSRIDTKKLILRILNHKEIRIYDSLEVNGKKTQKFNKSETLLALEKVEILEKAFRTYVENHNLESAVEKAYNEKFRYVVNRKYDGSFLNLPDLYDYQKDAVARIIFNKNTLLAHNVGAGKTFIMIAAGEELLRLGYSTKNLYVVPNNIIGQWEDIYRSMYPNAKLLTIYPKDYTIHTMDDVLNEVKNGDYSAVLTTYSVFDRIEHDIDIEITMLLNKINDLTKYSKDPSYGVRSSVRSSIKELNKKVDELKKKVRSSSLTFEELGFTRLFVDEAHNYKNIGLQCNRSSISGVVTNGSAKCNNMLMAVDYLNSVGSGVVMATGTPITNSVTDVYVFQRYLQSGELKLLNIDTFDKWLSVFAEITDEIEVDVDTTKYVCKSRINKFHNIDELSVILSNVADFCNPSQDKELPVCSGYTDTVIERNPQFDLYLEGISKRVDLIRKNAVDRKDDNLLKITVDGRLAALDLRLISPLYIKPYHNKVDSCVVNVCNNYVNYTDTTQIIFCDLSIPKDSFNIYDELKKGLVGMGIPSEEVEFIHNGSTEAKKKKILKAFNDGVIRVLIGSTFKLGTGVNVQKKLKAIHHFDVPWRPADMMQREGRIIREGNTNKEVLIHRYIQKASFDAYSWQILERKAKIIRELLANSLSEKETTDIDNTVLSYAEVKALAVGNDKIKEHIELCNKRKHLITLSKKQNERYAKLENEISVLQEGIVETKLSLENKLKDRNYLRENFNAISKIFEKYCFKKDQKDHVKRIRDFLESHKGLDHDTEWFSAGIFKVIIPSNFIIKNKYFLIKGNHTYKSDFREHTSVFGRHLYNDLYYETYYYNQEQYKVTNMEASIKTIERELANRISYDDDIKELSIKITTLEEELGVYDKESNE